MRKISRTESAKQLEVIAGCCRMRGRSEHRICLYKGERHYFAIFKLRQRFHHRKALSRCVLNLLPISLDLTRWSEDCRDNLRLSPRSSNFQLCFLCLMHFRCFLVSCTTFRCTAIHHLLKSIFCCYGKISFSSGIFSHSSLESTSLAARV